MAIDIKKVVVSFSTSKSNSFTRPKRSKDCILYVVEQNDEKKFRVYKFQGQYKINRDNAANFGDPVKEGSFNVDIAPIFRFDIFDRRLGFPVLSVDCEPRRSFAEIKVLDEDQVLNFNLAVQTPLLPEEQFAFLTGQIASHQLSNSKGPPLIRWGHHQNLARGYPNNGFRVPDEAGQPIPAPPLPGNNLFLELKKIPTQDSITEEAWNTAARDSEITRNIFLGLLPKRLSKPELLVGRTKDREKYWKNIFQYCNAGEWVGDNYKIERYDKGTHIGQAKPQQVDLQVSLIEGPCYRKEPKIPVYNLEFRREFGGIAGQNIAAMFPLDAPQDETAAETKYTLVQRQFPLSHPEAMKAGSGLPPLPWFLMCKGRSPLFEVVWNSVADHYLDSLVTIRQDRPVSAFPHIRPTQSGQSCNLVCRMDFERNGASIVPLHAGPEDLDALLKGAPGQSIDYPCRAIFRQLRTTANGDPLILDIRFKLSPLAGGQFSTLIGLSQGAGEEPIPFMAGQLLTVDGEPSASSVRLGAYELSLIQRAIDGAGSADDKFEVFLSSQPSPSQKAEKERLPSIVETDFKFQLPLKSFAPAAQDRVPAELEKSERPLLISLPVPAAGEGDGNPPEAMPGGQLLRLVVKEQAGPGSRREIEDLKQNLKLTVLSGTAPVPARRLLLIDTEPFFVGVVNMPALLTTSENANLAHWDSDGSEGPYWRVVAERSGYTLELPPQAIGESMVRARDYKADGTGPQFEEKALADFRFGTNARLEVYTSWREKKNSIVEPPHNTRRIFGFASQRAPGAPLIRADFELLYGLQTRVTGNSKRLVTELAAEAGLLPPLIDRKKPDWSAEFQKISDKQLDHFNAFKGHWEASSDAFRRRLSVLMLQDKISGVTKPITEDIEFELRRNAQIRPPVIVSPQSKAPRERQDSLLDGGADWGFESASVHEEVWNEPKSFDGEVGFVHLSALGAWGKQRALFANRKTAIVSESGQGRTHFYSLVRIGRIGVFWNRCKHVIVYERTVNASKQFSYPAHQKRPFVRKVHEYVEVLEPERRFPEASSNPVSRGCIEACVFRSKIINVNSAWGEDLAGHPDNPTKPGRGWKVPLWNSLADPSVYPRPQIELRLAGDPNGEGLASPAYAEIEPDNLYFFTSTRDGDTDQTDAWPPVESVDYVNLPLPRAPAVEHFQRSSPAGGDQRLPPDRAVVPGFQPVTFHLSRAGGRSANLVGGRVEEAAMSAVLDTVTLMRPAYGPTKTTIPAASTESALVEATRKLSDVAASFADALDTASSTVDDINARIERELENSKAKIAEVRNLAGDLQEKLSKESKEFCGRMNSESKAAAARVVGEIKGIVETLKKDILLAAQLPDKFKTFSEDLEKRIERLFVRITNTVSDPINRIAILTGNKSGAAVRSVETVQNAIIEWHSKCTAAIAVLEAQATLESTAAARAVRDAKAQIERDYALLTTRLVKYYSAILPRIAKNLDDKLAAAGRSLAQKLLGLDAAADKLEQSGASAKAALQTFRNDLLYVKDGLVANLDDVNNEIVKLQGSVGTAIEDRKTAFEAVPKNILKALHSMLDDMRTDLNRPFVELKGIVEGWHEKATIKLDELASGLSAPAEKLAGVVCGDVDGVLNNLLEKIKTGDFEKLFLDTAGKVSLEAALKHFGIDGDAKALQLEMRRRFGQIEGKIAESLRGTEQQLAGIAGEGLTLLRAFGDAPTVPSLDFNRRQIAYFFQGANIDTTPVTALLDRAGAGLKGLGLRMPVEGIGDKLLPKLENLNLSELFPDFAGIRLDNLFPGLKAPSLARENLVVKHGFDKQTLRAWVDAEVLPLRLGENGKLFSFAALSVEIRNPEFAAKARLETGANGEVERTSHGRIRGDWVASFGNKEIITFVDTPLSFDKHGDLNFELDPTKIKLTPELNFLDKFLQSVPGGGEKGGLTVGVLQEGVVPVGVECLLDLPVPPMTYGAFGISGLRFISGIQLRAFPKFSIAVHAALGATSSPFTITIFILGGSGWIEAWGEYTPSSQEITCTVSIAIGVSATLGFNFGVLNGIVQLFIGIKGSMRSSTAGGGSLSVSMIWIARGQVDVAGLITAGLFLMLEMRIEDGGNVYGEGTASFSIRLGPFFTYRVAQRVSYRLAGSGKTENENAAKRHSDRLV